jgi:predicted RNA-binding Zn-ribbon protein involved in translation (DUF1610 family)
MKANTITKTFWSALLALGIIAPAVAGPGQQEVYRPVLTLKQAANIKPGTRLATECGLCGTMKTMVADTGRSYLHSYTCETCHRKFVLRTNAHGETYGAYICDDGAGHQAKLLQML